MIVPQDGSISEQVSSAEKRRLGPRHSEISVSSSHVAVESSQHEPNTPPTVPSKQAFRSMLCGEGIQLSQYDSPSPSGEHNGRAKLTEIDVLAIRYRLAEGHTCRALAPIFGVSESTISNIKAGHRWRHLR